MPEEPTYGQVDLPLRPGDPDRLSIDDYYSGLATFISHCHTPMTVAVQGDWGSGKTSAINLVRSKIEHQRVEVIECNTWVLSQFELGDSLIFSLGEEILRPLAADSAAARHLVRTFGRIARAVAGAAATSLGVMTGTGAFVESAKDVIVTAEQERSAKSVVTELRELRDQFEKAVAEHLDASGPDGEPKRLVIFVDDLDRIDPARAIELLEAMKLFFEVPRCVFVLAVDFDVVVRGVKAKYGADFEEQKARQFFDKIIQLPFSMPVAAYDVRPLLAEALASLECTPAVDVVAVEELVLRSVGRNPRGIKRLLNSFQLLHLIARQGVVAKEFAAHEVFALLCAQVAYPEFHRQFVASVQSAGDDESWAPPEIDGESNDADMARSLKLTEQQLGALRDFREVLVRQTADVPNALCRWRTAVELARVTAVDRGVNGTAPARVAGVDAVVSHIVQRVSSGEATVVRPLLEGLARRLEERRLPFSVGGPQSSNYVTLSTAPPASDPGARARTGKTFALLRFGRSAGVRLEFGRRPNANQGASQAPYGPEWRDVVQRFAGRFPGGDGRPAFSAREGAKDYPLTITGLDVSSVEEVVQALTEIYAVVARG